MTLYRGRGVIRPTPRTFRSPADTAMVGVASRTTNTPTTTAPAPSHPDEGHAPSARPDGSVVVAGAAPCRVTSTTMWIQNTNPATSAIYGEATGGERVAFSENGKAQVSKAVGEALIDSCDTIEAAGSDDEEDSATTDDEEED